MLEKSALRPLAKASAARLGRARTAGETSSPTEERQARIRIDEHTLTRAEVARELGTSSTSVRRLEAAGALHPRRDALGVWRFSAVEIEQAKATRRPRARDVGDVAGRAYALFARGRVAVDAVTELSLEPRVADELYAHWSRSQPVTLPEPLARELVELGCASTDGVLRPAGLVATVRALRERVRELRELVRSKGGA